MDQIIDLKAGYQADEYIPRYNEAAAIHNWLNSTHDVFNVGEPPRDCPVCGFPHDTELFRTLVLEKLARRNGISSEIDEIWAEYALDAWATIPENSRQAYPDWCDSQESD